MELSSLPRQMGQLHHPDQLSLLIGFVRLVSEDAISIGRAGWLGGGTRRVSIVALHEKVPDLNTAAQRRPNRPTWLALRFNARVIPVFLCDSP